jgi:hypothetical protein
VSIIPPRTGILLGFIVQGFHFRFPDGGGMVPPLRGGTQGGVIGQQGGGMARDPDATMNTPYAYL